MSRFVNTPRTGVLLQNFAGGGNIGVTRYVGNFVLGTWTTSFTSSRRKTSGSVAERLSRRRLLHGEHIADIRPQTSHHIMFKARSDLCTCFGDSL